MKYYNTTNSPIATPDGEGGHFWFPAMAVSEDIDQEKIDRLIELEPHLAVLIGSTLKPLPEDAGSPTAPVLTITSPEAGATLPPVHDITGTGAMPWATVELWHVEGDTVVATTQADGEGNFVFGGDTPASLGEVTWQVKSDGKVDQQSAPVAIIVEEPPEPEETDEGGDENGGDESGGEPRRLRRIRR